MIKYPQYLFRLISALKRLPGIGYKTAEKLAFEMLLWPEEKLKEVSSAIQDVSEAVSFCSECFCLKDVHDACSFCSDPDRESEKLCVVASCKDVFLLEKAKVFRGDYHVLGSLLSPITGKKPELVRMQMLKERIQKRRYKEIIISLDATLEGDTTAMFIKEELLEYDVAISRLALGIPMGLSFDYVDSGTLARAFSGRNSY
ncbi:recombination mediator RecR [Chlamydiifrater phoenicopteri]|uniref:recombination mediator RecR n=1 Tax=Chlamydiifrater phoenicopteri TaxID=2681469 RepID=UPI001BCB8011|nr:recombination mediator RecR [Chlamydiifrater phoenicopteri]